MRSFHISLFAATISAALVAMPTANAADTTLLPAKSGSGMMRGGKTGSAMMGGGSAKGEMRGMMGMMAMMNACTRVMNKMADNMGHGAIGYHHGNMMDGAQPKKS